MSRRFNVVLAVAVVELLLGGVARGAAQDRGSQSTTNEKDKGVASSSSLNAPLSSSAVEKGGSKERTRSADSGAPRKTDDPSPPDSSIYRIGIEDELLISVWKEPDLSTAVVVRPDGMITLPLLNDIQIVGLQTSELQALLTERLKPYVNEPQVTVIVRGIKSRKVYVYGQVGRAGAYLIVGRKTVLEALADAGGLSPFAKKGSIYVMRNSVGKQSKIPFNYGKALKGEKPNDNFELFPGDIVVVP